jgi:RimJ/RimL family protein N-acetyltransferase
MNTPTAPLHSNSGLVIQTERLYLRPFREDDAAFVLDIFNDSSFVRFIGDRRVRTLDEARAYIAKRLLANHHLQGLGPFLVQTRDTGISIGFCTLFQRDWLETADLGFAFLPEYRSRGFAIETSRALLDHASNGMGLTRLVAIASSENEASAKLLRRLGFTETGMIRPPGEETDVVLFAIDLD